jgi:hypothetical protein
MFLSGTLTKGQGDLFSNIIMLIFSILATAGTASIINNFGQIYLAVILLTVLCYIGTWVFAYMYFESREKYKAKSKTYTISLLVSLFVVGYTFATLG